MAAPPPSPPSPAPSAPDPPSVSRWSKLKHTLELTIGLIMLAGIVFLIIGGGIIAVGWWNERDYRAAVAAVECREDDNCWGQQHHMAAEQQCRPMIERRARYQYQWTNGVTEWQFPKWSFAELDGSSGVLVYEGSKIQFQNAFGVWQRMYYGCYYDPGQASVVGVSVRPY